MASIKNAKRTKEGMILQVNATYDEYLELEGNMDKIHLFAEKENPIKTRISQRGKNGATKYFLIPREMRKGIKFNNKISCYKSEKEGKALFLYVVDKFSTVTKKEISLKRTVHLKNKA